MDALKEPKSILEKHARVQLHPYAHPTPVFGGHHILRVGRTVELITHARFQVSRFRSFAAPWAENDPLSLRLDTSPLQQCTH